MSSFSRGALLQLQSLSLEQKVSLTRKRIKAWFTGFDGQIYVAFSGGKDSTVLKDIVDDCFSGIPAVFVNTGLEYPEIRRFALEQSNVVVLKPALRFDEVIEKYGYPVISKEQASYIQEYRTTTSEKLKNYRWNGNGKGSYKISEKWKYLVDAPFKISDKCCDIMKKNPTVAYEKETGRKPIIGTMCEESLLRYNQWVRYGCNAFNKTRPTSQPLSFWTEQDILLYIKTRNLPIASVYGDVVEGEDGKLHLTGVTRTGCMFCMFGIQNEAHPNKFERMKETHPNAYKYCMEKLGIGKVLDFIQVEH